MPTRNPLQEQLLKAGLVKKNQVSKVAREQAKSHQGKTPTAPSASQQEAQRLQAEKAERDRAIAAERNAQARANESRAQIQQIIEAHKLKPTGDIAYRFTDGDRIKDVLVNEALRAQLAAGTLVIVRYGNSYALLPRSAADKVCERDASMIVLDHGHTEPAPVDDTDDAYYQQFKVPDDLIW